MKRKRFLLYLVLLILSIIVLALGRYSIWRRSPWLRCLSVYAISYHSFVGKPQQRVYEILGDPDYTNHFARLALFAPGIDEKRTHVLMFYLDRTNRITGVSSSVTRSEKPFSKQEWQLASGIERARMMPDFVEQWNNGKEPLIRTYDDIAAVFPGCHFVYDIKYALDWANSLVVRLDTNGIVVASQIVSN
jgi:hypothetical protein